ncbi:MAG: glycerophosphodiester phosphodiesterase [Armatimonadetes bacterium]|nr:glycerophosphodiester phosphodiesterase [Armatimonadota bacterium]
MIWTERQREAGVIRVGHRGAPKLEPENTLRSYRSAMEMGVDMIEVDLRQTADGALVLAHDETIHGTEGRSLSIPAHSLEELRAVDLEKGERIPTLSEAIAMCQGRCAMMIDLKGEGFEEGLVRTLRQTGYRNVVVPGGGIQSRERIRRMDPEIPLSLSLDRAWDDRITPEFIDSLDTDAVTWQYPLLNRERVERLHDRGLWVFAWTVDAWVEMERLVSMGVDGIISNRTDLLMQLS